MQQERLKSLVETGNYRPKPALVAEAMLKRRGVRELLAEESHAAGTASAFSPGAQIRPTRATGPQAA
jgi:hypothetical protein